MSPSYELCILPNAASKLARDSSDLPQLAFQSSISFFESASNSFAFCKLLCKVASCSGRCAKPFSELVKSSSAFCKSNFTFRSRGSFSVGSDSLVVCAAKGGAKEQNANQSSASKQGKDRGDQECQRTLHPTNPWPEPSAGFGLSSFGRLPIALERARM